MKNQFVPHSFGYKNQSINAAEGNLLFGLQSTQNREIHYVGRAYNF